MPGRPVRRKFLKDVKEAGGWEAIFDRIASGETQRTIAKSFGISESFFCRVLREDEGRRALQTEAKKERAHVYSEQALELADDAEPERDKLTKVRLQIEQRRWMAERDNREAYGETKPELTVNIGQLHLDAVRVRAVKAVPSELVIQSTPRPALGSGSEADDAA